MDVLNTVDVVKSAGGEVGVTGHNVVVTEINSVVSFPMREGQSVMVGAHDVTV